MVHLKPLPGTTRYDGLLEEIFESAMNDANALDLGGIDAIMVENYGDVPFRKSGVAPHTIAIMTLVVEQIRGITGKPVGVNVLRNDPIAALGIAAASMAAMIRVNVHTGAMLTDQGIIEGDASATLAYRRTLGAEIMILADVNVKHALPLAPFPIEEAAADAVERGLADALIVTGTRTGAGADLEDLRRVRAAVNVPVLVGSGVTDESVRAILAECDGAIVGSWLKENGDVSRPVDKERVRRLMEAARG